MKHLISIGLVATALASTPVQAAQVCGWYAIAACTRSASDAANFANNGWGAVIDTRNYVGFKPGFFCVVSGPQPKSSAARDVRIATTNGVAKDMYIKRACTDESNLGD